LPDPRHRLGWEGEKFAAKELRRAGYKVLYRNYRAPGGGEVDLVCRKGDTLVFVEVKTRRSSVYGAPAEAVTKDKQQLISRGALAWLKLLGSPAIYFRFDIVEVLFVDGRPTSCIIENAFTLPERYRY